MRKSRMSSPARSQGDPRSPKRYKTRHSQSLTTSPGRTSGRLTSLVDQFKQNNRESLPFSPLSKTVLNDNTDIEQPRRESWWKQLHNSRDVVEVLDGNKPEAVNNILEEFDVEVLSQSQKKDHTLDLPESSDNESIGSIVVLQRKLFTQKENVPQKKFGQVIATRETLTKQNKTAIDNEINDIAGTKRLFGQGAKRNKPVFPAALLNISPDKTIFNKTKELVAEVKAQPRSLFGNSPAAKRKNIFADFIVSESEDEIPDIEPKRFTFCKRPEPIRRVSSASRGTREPSPTMSITTDIEMDDWKMLPSSTMVDYQLEAIVATTPGKKIRLSKLSEAKESEAGTGITGNTDIKSDKSKSSIKSNVENFVNDNEQDNEEEFNLTYDDNEQPECIDDNAQTENNKTEGEPRDKTHTIRKSPNKTEQNVSIKSVKDHSKAIDNKTHTIIKSSDKTEQNITVRNNSITEHSKIDTTNNKSVKASHVEKQEVSKEIEDDDKQSAAESEAENDEQEPNVEIENHEKSVDAEFDVENHEKSVDAESDAENEEENDANLVNKTGDEEDEQNEVHENNDEDLQANNTQKEVEDESQEQVEDEEIEENDEVDQEESEEQINESLEQELVDENVEDEQEGQESEEDENEKNQEAELEEHEIESHDEIKNTEENQETKHENNIEPIIESPNESHDTTGRHRIKHRTKSPEISEKIKNNEKSVDAESDAENEQENYANLENNETGDEEDEESDVAESDAENEQENDANLENNETGDEEDEENDVKEYNDEDLQANSNNTQEEVVDESQEQVEDEEIEENDEVDQEESEEQINESLEQELVDENVEDEQEGQESEENEENQEAELDENEIESHDEIENTEENQEKHRTKSPEAILHEMSNEANSFIVKGRNTSIRKKSILKNFTIRQSMAPPRESTGLSDGTRNSSAEGSGWDSHRTTRKTLRQTFGKDFTPRKSLRALVMEKSAKRQTQIDVANAELREPQANSTELQDNLPQDSEMDFEDNVEMAESDHDVSKRTRQTTLEMYLQKIKKDDMERLMKLEEQVRNSFKPAPLRSNFLITAPYNPQIRRANTKSLKKPVTKKLQKPCMFPIEDLPPELIDDMKYRPPKRFRPSNAPWITKRLYKFLETKLEPKYDYKARVRAEKLVETIYHFAKDAKKYRTAQPNSVIELKKEMARLNVVNTHYDFYNFFRDYMPLEVKVKVVPDIVNEIPLPREGLFSNIVSGQ